MLGVVFFIVLVWCVMRAASVTLGWVTSGTRAVIRCHVHHYSTQATQAELKILAASEPIKRKVVANYVTLLYPGKMTTDNTFVYLTEPNAVHMDTIGCVSVYMTLDSSALQTSAATRPGPGRADPGAPLSPARSVRTSLRTWVQWCLDWRPGNMVPVWRVSRYWQWEVETSFVVTSF